MREIIILWKLADNFCMNEITYHLIDLPLTRLHYLKCGHGKPLVILPATISAIDNWLNLVQFLAQKFTVYFFELPGHGQSKAFISTYKSDLVARTVEDFLDKLGISRFYLMGFSFGVILTTDFEQLGIVIPQKCLFGMSIYDPLLDFNVTKRIMRKLFMDITVKEFDFPFHQPPEPFTVEYLQQHFGYLLNEV